MNLDTKTDSNWSQMRQIAVSGEFIERVPERIPFIELSWAGAKLLADELKVLSTNTSPNRDYNSYPYGDYRTNNSQINYPLEYKDDRIPAKERVLAVIINDKVKAYRFQDFK